LNIISFDPGLRECGVAQFDGPDLVACAMPTSDCKKERGIVAWNAMAEAVCPWIMERAPAVLVYEMMEAYPGNSAAKNANLLQLTGVLGAVGAVLTQVEGLKFVAYLPKQWKGQVKKDIHHRRVTGATSKRTGRWRPGILTYEELAIFEEARSGVALSKQHNILDGIAIGLYHVGRGPVWR